MIIMMNSVKKASNYFVIVVKKYNMPSDLINIVIEVCEQGNFGRA